MENFWFWDLGLPIIIQAFVNMAVALTGFSRNGANSPI